MTINFHKVHRPVLTRQASGVSVPCRAVQMVSLWSPFRHQTNCYTPSPWVAVFWRGCPVERRSTDDTPRGLFYDFVFKAFIQRLADGKLYFSISWKFLEITGYEFPSCAFIIRERSVKFGVFFGDFANVSSRSLVPVLPGLGYVVSFRRSVDFSSKRILTSPRRVLTTSVSVSWDGGFSGLGASIFAICKRLSSTIVLRRGMAPFIATTRSETTVFLLRKSLLRTSRRSRCRIVDLIL